MGMSSTWGSLPRGARKFWVCITSNYWRNEWKVIVCDGPNVQIQGPDGQTDWVRESGYAGVRVSTDKLSVGSYSMNANRFGKLVAPSAAQEIGRNGVIASGGSRIAGDIPVGRTYVRVMKLRRVLCEVSSLDPFKVRPLKPSSSLIFSIMNQTELYH